MRFCLRMLLIVMCSSLMNGAYGTYGQDLKFDHLTLEDGLSESTVLAVTQDIQGFMWFGTREGLNRFDGRRVKVFRNDPLDSSSLSDNFIYSVYSDSHGRLWVGTRTGVNLFDAGSETFERYLLNREYSAPLSDNTVTCMLEDRQKNLWVGTRHGLHVFSNKTDSVSFSPFFHQPGEANSLVNDDIHTIFLDNDGVLWIGTMHGFARLKYKDQTDYSLISFALPQLNGKYEKNNSVNTFSEDDDGNLLVGTERNGLLFFNKATFEFSEKKIKNESLKSKAIRTIIKDPRGNFWIGSIGGLYIATRDFSSVRTLRNVHDNPASLSDNSVRSMFYDRDGSYWVGTFHGGVNIYSPLSKQFRHLMPQSQGRKLSFKIASAITTDRDRNFWIGTEGSGLLFLDAESNVKKHFKHEERNQNSLCHDNIKCLLVEEGKGIWIGTIKGLDFYDFGKKTFIHFRNASSRDNNALPDDVIYDLVKDEKGRLWVATYFGGLALVDRTRRIVEKIYSHDPQDANSLSSRAVTRLFIDSKQNLWVGTAGGLNKMRHDGSFVRVLNDNAGAPPGNSYIVSIHEDKQGRLWVGTRGAGLNLLSQDGKLIRHLSREDGLPGNSISAIAEDSRGFLWNSTENGLSRIDPKTFSIKNYNRSDGLLCNEFNFNSHHCDPTGVFYFGGYNGVAYFHPDSIYENSTIPSLAFTTFRLFNKEIKASDHPAIFESDVKDEPTLKLRYNQNVFSVEFAVLNFINSGKNQFAYMLQGFEDEWNYVKEPIATYMNLTPGTYTLLVKGSNNDGLWNETPKALSIHILPPPWKTWWAYCGYCITFLLLLYTWTRLNKKQLRLEHDLRLEHMEKVKQEELHQAKLNFFTNVAHEIRTPVTLMTAPIEHLLESNTQNPKVKKELILVKNNTDRLVRLINQLLDFQKQETGNVKLKVTRGNIVAFVKEIVDSFKEYADSRKVQLNFHAVSEPGVLWFDREELSKVFYNILQNAMKFTPGGGAISVSISNNSSSGMISQGDDNTVIVIEDNGLGISQVNLEKIFHRFYQAENTGVQDAGFGIGLSLTKGIIELHHGKISVQSREATTQLQGLTRFTIVLRTGRDHFLPEEISEESDTNVLKDTIRDLDGERECDDSKPVNEKPLILLVEDNTEIRIYMRDFLMNNFEVLECKNGYEGAAIALERLPDLIVSDVIMPVMNGIELVAKLKKDERTNHIPIILLTARGTLNHQVEGLATGADDYLTKPFNTNLLLAKIRNHLKIREKLREKYSRVVSIQPVHEEIPDPDDRFLQRLLKVLEGNIENPEFNVTRLVKEIGMSRPVLFRKTKMVTGLSVIDLIRNVRLKKAAMLLKQKKLSVSEIAFTVGFSDPKHFSKSFRNQYGKPPSQYMDESNEE